MDGRTGWSWNREHIGTAAVDVENSSKDVQVLAEVLLFQMAGLTGFGEVGTGEVLKGRVRMGEVGMDNVVVPGTTPELCMELAPYCVYMVDTRCSLAVTVEGPVKAEVNYCLDSTGSLSTMS